MKNISIIRYNVGVDFGSEQMDAKLAAQYEDGTRKIYFPEDLRTRKQGLKI
jgi:hypothetical protein